MTFSPLPSPRPPPIISCFCLSEFGAILQNQQLIYNQIDTNEYQIFMTGMYGPFVGTYLDTEKIYVIDREHAFTNEVTILPSWCE